MFEPQISQTEEMTLDEVLARLAQNEAVEGVLLIGSTRELDLRPHSDYDLLVVLREMPLPPGILLTVIDDRLADILFVRSSFVDKILSPDFEEASDEQEGFLLEHLKNGSIAYDRDGRIRKVQHKLIGRQWFVKPNNRRVYTEAVRGIHYNYQHNRRYFDSSEPIYQTALEVRLLYSLMQVILSYFIVRRLPWQGEVKAIQYWRENDPDFLTLFETYQGAPNLKDRFKAYTKMAERTLEPVGGLWPRNAVSVALEGDAWGTEEVSAAVDYWHSLIF